MTTTPNLKTGTDILSDNWQLMLAAGFLSGKMDPHMEMGFVYHGIQGPEYGTILGGVFQLDSIVNLLEQITFASSINVMDKWTRPWKQFNSELNTIYESDKIIKPIAYSEHHLSKKQTWLNNLLLDKKLAAAVRDGEESFKRNEKGNPNSFLSQIIVGLAEYLSISQTTNLSYSPHSARGGYLRSSSWDSLLHQATKPFGTSLFDDTVKSKHCRASSILNERSALKHMQLNIPSAALLALAESSAEISPLQVALQIRNDSQIKELRQVIHEITLENNEHVVVDLKGVKRQNDNIAYLNSLIEKAHQQLAIEKPNQDMTSVRHEYFTYTSYSFNSAVYQSSDSHNGMLTKLLLTNEHKTGQLIHEKLGFDLEIVRQYQMWMKDDFFKKNQSSSDNQ